MLTDLPLDIKKTLVALYARHIPELLKSSRFYNKYHDDYNNDDRLLKIMDGSIEHSRDDDDDTLDEKVKKLFTKVVL